MRAMYQMKRFSNSRAGFTMVELLIVVVIIAILASLILPRFTDQTVKARMAEAINILGALRKAVLQYYDENGQWPSNMSSLNANEVTRIRDNLGLDIPPRGSISSGMWKFLYSVSMASGTTQTTVTSYCVVDTYGNSCPIVIGESLIFVKVDAISPPSNAPEYQKSRIYMLMDGTLCGSGDFSPTGGTLCAAGNFTPAGRYPIPKTR